MTSEPGTDATQVATMIIDAIERADREERNFGLDDLCAEVAALPSRIGSAALKRCLILAASRCAERLVPDWQKQYPDDLAPVLALRAAQAWLANPGPDTAVVAASLSSAALNSFARIRGSGRRPSWPAIAWFARACAWLADAPQFEWQAVAALHGLVQAGARDSLLTELHGTLVEVTR